VKQRYEAGQLALGTYVTLPTGRAVEVLAGAGLDFVRLDPYKFPWPRSLTAEVVAAARRGLMTPWARIDNDPAAIRDLLEFGIQIVTVPEIDTAEQAKELVSVIRHRPANARDGAGDASEILVGCQIETVEGIKNYRAIIGTEGVDIIHTGRNDISHALGVPGDQFHPRVLEVERRIVEATLEAGKQPALLYPLTDQGIELAAEWVRFGVRIFALDMDYRLLHRAYSQVAELLRTCGHSDGGSRDTMPSGT